MEKYDFLAIGDITTDAFIRIKDASVHCDVNRKNCELCVRFGDKIPYEFVEVIRAVGNSPNASVSASRLGLKSALLTNIGDDENGKECIEILKKENISDKFIKTHPGRLTNYHYVLWYEDERTIFIKHEEYDYEMPDIGNPSWIYLSSLAENSLPFHEKIANYLESHTDIKLAFQPGTFQIKQGYEKLKKIYEHTEVFFCNVEESKKILNTEESDIKKLLQEMKGLGPKIVIITDGPKGVFAFEDGVIWHMPMYPDPKPPLDRTGAGDSFSSTFISALAHGLPVRDALRWGPINSMSVVQEIGAQKGLLTRNRLEKLLLNAPTDYKPQKI
jgi:ribokinase